ncbi:hypothetical protein [Asticcacaulis sp. EMRT-3]|uniref:hypothetical protein n=1 Tax=Asticcacaulis sp. EMRT-3 TaxID=3040349 RepID=UPI0024AF4379|nr:hypothetical protein [Asticcacaulis sp. EMRT-3]MDI7774083.1 hypothetical protein [Asticcacaulis sp. EMRT-3]
MRALLIKLVSVMMGIGLLAVAGQAMACNTGCAPPPPPTPPHNPRPPCNACGGHGGHGGGGNVNVNVNVNASASATASAGSSAGGTYYGGGYGNWSQTPGYPQEAGNLNVVGGDCCSGRSESYSEQQTMTKRVIIQATCIDDTGVPHPASQLSADREVASGYRGELYRCIAGTHMQWTAADYDGSHINFNGGQTNICKKDEALWDDNGTLSCRAQIPERQCNERSLLRRFGAGIKILTMTRTETITKQRKVACSACQSKAVMTFDGGVGGFVQ